MVGLVGPRMMAGGDEREQRGEGTPQLEKHAHHPPPPQALESGAFLEPLCLKGKTHRGGEGETGGSVRGPYRAAREEAVSSEHYWTSFHVFPLLANVICCPTSLSNRESGRKVNGERRMT